MTFHQGYFKARQVFGPEHQNTNQAAALVYTESSCMSPSLSACVTGVCLTDLSGSEE